MAMGSLVFAFVVFLLVAVGRVVMPTAAVSDDAATMSARVSVLW